jgi:cytochrome c
MPPKKEPAVTIPAGADAANGKSIFEQQCSSCHAVSQGDDKTAAAPSLGGVVGRAAGNGAFPYSPALKKSGITWTDKHLFAFLKAPAKYVAGTRMSYAGLAAEKDRADLIEYLKST